MKETGDPLKKALTKIIIGAPSFVSYDFMPGFNKIN